MSGIMCLHLKKSDEWGILSNAPSASRLHMKTADPIEFMYSVTSWVRAAAIVVPLDGINPNMSGLALSVGSWSSIYSSINFETTLDIVIGL